MNNGFMYQINKRKSKIKKVIECTKCVFSPFDSTFTAKIANKITNS